MEQAESENKPAGAPSELNDGLAAFVTKQHIKDLQRFAETCEDGEGYDVPKMRMISLMKCGLVARTTRDVYMTTDFGEYILEVVANVQG